MDTIEGQRLYAEFRAVELELHRALPPITEQPSGADAALGLRDVDIAHTAALIEVMRQRWVRFQDFAES